jgi:predicted flap endonuclease-1-like 5' DNA nuclease
MAKLIDIEGIGPAYAEKLSAAGLTTTDGLLKEAGTAKGRAALAAKTSISEARILEWVNRADLMRVKGVGEEFSDLLETTGVDSVKELATRNADNLHAALAATNEAKKLVRRAPTLAEGKGWIDHAKSLDVAVTH